MNDREWLSRIDAYIEEENKKSGEILPVYRIYCQDNHNRSGGGLYNETVTIDTIGRLIPIRFTLIRFTPKKHAGAESSRPH